MEADMLYKYLSHLTAHYYSINSPEYSLGIMLKVKWVQQTLHLFTVEEEMTLGIR